MSFTPPPRDSFLQVDANKERAKEAQARMGRVSKKKHAENDGSSENQAAPQGLLSRLLGMLRGQP